MTIAVVTGAASGLGQTFAEVLAKARHRRPFLVTKAALPHRRAAGWGRTVNIVPAVVFPGPPELVAYTTSKAGVVGFTRALPTELGP